VNGKLNRGSRLRLGPWENLAKATGTPLRSRRLAGNGAADAVKNWKRKRERGGADLDDQDCLRNYCQAAMRNNREAGKFQIMRVSRVASASPTLSSAVSVEEKIPGLKPKGPQALRSCRLGGFEAPSNGVSGQRGAQYRSGSPICRHARCLCVRRFLARFLNVPGAGLTFLSELQFNLLRGPIQLRNPEAANLSGADLFRF
jgi:hypothetical protein